MPQYPLLNLSPAEFEDLSRDLLQKFLKVHLESFTSGRDGGIDFRYAASKEENLIVQCKRYANFNNLHANLKKEAKRLNELNPTRYILTTTVGLTPFQKKKILKLFGSYIANPSDIFGREDLNNLLGQYPEIEHLHIKLWLSSVTILERILHSKVYNQTSFELEKIKETIELYVNNSSYVTAKDLIDRYRYLVISGSPGIGKTTLARVLTYYYLGCGYQDFIFLSDSIDEGYAMFKEGRKQIFLFDDFLGKTFLERSLATNEDERILRFIERIHKSKNKLLILTTREYILSQARDKYEALNRPSIDLAKCIIDLEKYTKLVRAKILYNHIFFSGLAQPYVEKLLEHSNYNKIINHKNYSPRIIEMVLQKISTIPLQKFVGQFVSYLDYPESIWGHVYESRISTFSRLVLANMLTCGSPILLSDLQLVMKSFCAKNGEKYGIHNNQFAFNKSIKELQNTFITLSVDMKGNDYVDYLNPSVQDFLTSYLNNLKDILSDVIDAALFFHQLFTFFEYPVSERFLKTGRRTRILLDNTLIKKIVNRIYEDFVVLGNAQLERRGMWNMQGFYFEADRLSVYHKLQVIIDCKFFEAVPALDDFVLKIFQECVIPQSMNGRDIAYYSDLASKYLDRIEFNSYQILAAITANIDNLDTYNYFKQLENIFEEDYQRFITQDEDFRHTISAVINWEVDAVHSSDIHQLIEDINAIEDHTGFSFQNIVADLQDKFEESYEDDFEDEFQHRSINQSQHTFERDDETGIANLFDSLR